MEIMYIVFGGFMVWSSVRVIYDQGKAAGMAEACRLIDSDKRYLIDGVYLEPGMRSLHNFAYFVSVALLSFYTLRGFLEIMK